VGAGTRGPAVASLASHSHSRTRTGSMDAFDRDARVWSPVWSPESGNDVLKDGKDTIAEVDMVTMRW
jgi:hypothetical protein